MAWRPIVLPILIIGSLTCSARAVAEDVVDYQRLIKPILRERCYACHGALKQEGGLRLDTAATAIKGGESGSAIVASDADASLLLARISAKDEAERMPPEGEPLSAEQIALFERWIAGGAVAPADEQPERDPREHWAFQPPQRAELPQVANPPFQQNPIDAFLQADLERLGLASQPRATRSLWLRRVYLDLIGLPPTAAELSAFAANESPQAYESVVDELLQRPQYGERWGRHWMDIWRYSDSWGLGGEVRNSQKHLWHWRDWIVESLNADVGYDQMVREMLAADELYPNDLDKLRAGGFLARQYFKFNRTTWLDATVEHTSKAFLGLTLNCAKCHDHKYDPLSQQAYYEYRAIFEPYQVRTDIIGAETDLEKDGIARPFDCHLEEPTYLHVRGDESNPDKTRPLQPATPAVLGAEGWNVASVALPAEAHSPGLRPWVLQNYQLAASVRQADATNAVAQAQQQLREAERLAALPQPELVKQEPATPLVLDDFAAAAPDRWEERSGKWAYADGILLQHQDSGAATLELKQHPPADFEAKLRYELTGGVTWRSVGIAFDVSAAGAEPYEALAYLSGHGGGPKAQVSYKVAGNHVYPGEAAKELRIDLGETYEMTLRVRGALVNVLVDGKPVVAYRLPVARRAGALQLITYDAIASFQRFELRELTADVAMVEPGAQPSATPDGALQFARVDLKLAEAALTVQAAELASLESRATAQRATIDQPAAEQTKALAREAARLERVAAAAVAQHAVATADVAMVKGDATKKDELEKKYLAARELAAKARQKIDEVTETFTPILGALKSLESSLETDEGRRKPFPQTSTGRRTALANWLTNRKHPLTARVAVNHIWLRHMGQPLVPTVFDFGRKGTPPTHPQLLDWLAVAFMEQGYSTKHLHRLICTSETYRLASSSEGADAQTLAADRENKYYWRMNPSRMQSEVVRDSLLQLAGELDPKLGGPSIPVADANSKRRSLYFIHSHNEHQPLLAMFDDASVLDCYRRAESIVPQQALALENSSQAQVASEKIAARLTAEAAVGADDAAFIRHAFASILCVEPTVEEQQLTLAALQQLVELATKNNRPQPGASARAAIVLALLNHNDFITVR